MENYNWIQAKLKRTGETVRVRQEKSCSGVFYLDNDVRCSIYELDFTQAPELPDFMKEFEESNKRYEKENKERQKMLNKMLSSMDAKYIADHKAKIDEREYWRKLRGDIALELIRQCVGSDFELIASKTEDLFDGLYIQHENFLNASKGE